MNRREAGRRTLDDHGWDITRIVYSKTGEDAHGDDQYNETRETIKGYVQFNSANAPYKTTTARGQEFSVDLFVYVRDDVDINDMRKDQRPDRLVIDDIPYEVIEAQIQHNGLIGCVVSRV